MRKFLNSARQSKSGAVTVDWIVLVAAILGLIVAITSTISTSDNYGENNLSKIVEPHYIGD